MASPVDEILVVDDDPTVRVLLPACERRRAPVSSGEALDEGVQGPSNPAILVVDDDEIVRGPSEQIVRRLGFESLAAATGEAALHIFREFGSRIVLAVIDLTMPGMNGAELLDRLRRLRPTLPVIVTSGFCEADALQSFVFERPTAFLQKPFRIERLAGTIAEALGRQDVGTRDPGARA